MFVEAQVPSSCAPRAARRAWGVTFNVPAPRGRLAVTPHAALAPVWPIPAGFSAVRTRRAHHEETSYRRGGARARARVRQCRTRVRRGAVEDRSPGHARGNVYGARRGRGPRIQGRPEQVRRQGRRTRDRGDHRRHRREPGLRDTRGAQGRGAGQGGHRDRTAVGVRGHRDQGLRQDSAAGDVHQRHLRRPGDHLRRSGAELLPLQHGRRAVVGRHRRVHLQREGLPRHRHHRRGLLVRLHPGVRTGARVLRPRWGGDRASLGSARHQGLRVDHRRAARGRRCDLPRTRRR